MALLESMEESTDNPGGIPVTDQTNPMSEPLLRKRPRSDSETQYISKYPELDYFDSNTDCSICFEPFFHPIRLECGHTFCKPCLEKLICVTNREVRLDGERRTAENNRLYKQNTANPHN